MATLETRLAKVELRLASADPTTTASPQEQPSSSSLSPATVGSLSDPQLHQVSPSAVSGLYEGSTSFLKQSELASEVAHRTATSAVSGTPEAARTINESFSHLESLLHSSADLQNPQPSNEEPVRSAPTITPLPAALVIAILRRIKCTYPYNTFSCPVVRSTNVGSSAPFHVPFQSLNC